MIDEIIADVRSQMKQTIESLQRDLGRIRAGRASPSLLDGLMVDYYGVDTPLNKLATVSAPEARLLVVQPFDQTAAAGIEKAIRVSDLGISPVSDGKVIRVPIPELTEERRKALVKQARKEAESHRISARNHRRDANEMLKQLVAEKEIGEDEAHSAQAKVQEATDECVTRIDEVLEAKEKAIMAV